MIIALKIIATIFTSIYALLMFLGTCVEAKDGARKAFFICLTIFLSLLFITFTIWI